MTRLIRFILPTLLLLALSIPLAAQSKKGQHKPRLRVAADREFLYDLEMNADMTQTMAGQEINTIIDARGDAHFKSDSVDRDHIYWTLAVPKLTVSMKGMMVPEGSKDTATAIPTRHLTTDRSGRLLAQSTEKREGESADMFMSAMGVQGGFASELFSPVITHGAKPGETWTEDSRDSVNTPGVSIVKHTVTRYWYDGLVDTLGKSTMRVRTSVDTMDVGGTIHAQGMELTLSGEGGGTGIWYHDAVSGLLVIGIDTKEQQMQASLGGQTPMVIPMVTTTRQVMKMK